MALIEEMVFRLYSLGIQVGFILSKNWPLKDNRMESYLSGL